MKLNTTLIAIITAALISAVPVSTAMSKTLVPHSLKQESKRAEKSEAQDHEKRVRMKDLPAAVQQTVREQSRGATIRGLSQETENGKTNYEAELRVNGHNRDVLINPSGAVVEIEEQVTLALLPPAVKKTIERNAGGGRVGMIEAITRGDAVAAYEAHVRKAGKSLEIKVSPDGQLITKGRD